MAFRELGHEAYSCDIQECSGGRPEWHIKADALELLKLKWDLIIAHPPCTYLTNAGAVRLRVGGDNRRRTHGESQRSKSVLYAVSQCGLSKNCGRESNTRENPSASTLRSGGATVDVWTSLHQTHMPVAERVTTTNGNGCYHRRYYAMGERRVQRRTRKLPQSARPQRTGPEEPLQNLPRYSQSHGRTVGRGYQRNGR